MTAPRASGGFGGIARAGASVALAGLAAAGLAVATLGLFAASAGEAEEPPPEEEKAWWDVLKGIELGPGKLDLGLAFRARYEYLDGFTIRGYGPARGDDVLLLRTRLSADYRFDEDDRVFVEFQDARYYLSGLTLGDFGRTSSYFDQFDLRQAYVEAKGVCGSAFDVKAGRQILLYADRRLFAPAEWGNVGNYWWDGVKVRWDAGPVDLDAIYAFRVLSETRDWNFDHWPYQVGALYARLRSLPFPLHAFYVAKHDWSDDPRGELGGPGEERHTFGVFSERAPGEGFDYGLLVAGQLGEYGRDSIGAFGAIARGGYTAKTFASPRAGFEFAYASGDRDPLDGDCGTFDGIFGAMDIPYGWMNLVSWKNLEDYSANVSVEPLGALWLSAEYHYFRLAEARDAWYWVSGKPERRDPTGRSGRSLGHEVDAIARWRAARGLELLCGYARFFPGAFARRTPGHRGGAHWAFAQLSLSF